MPDYDERAELAPRDVVSQAIVAQMEKTRQPSVFLDLSHLDAGSRAQAVSRASRERAPSSASTSRPIRFRCGPVRTT